MKLWGKITGRFTEPATPKEVKSFSTLIALGENSLKIKIIKRIIYREPSEYRTTITYNEPEPIGLISYELQLTDKQHEKLVEEMSKKIGCIVVNKDPENKGE